MTKNPVTPTMISRAAFRARIEQVNALRRAAGENPLAEDAAFSLIHWNRLGAELVRLGAVEAPARRARLATPTTARSQVLTPAATATPAILLQQYCAIGDPRERARFWAKHREALMRAYDDDARHYNAKLKSR